MKTRIGFAIACLWAASAAAAVYKWVDATGITQYSEFPPASGAAAEVHIAPVPAPELPPATEAEDGAALPDGSLADVTAEDMQARFARSRAVQCAQVRETIRVLQIRGPVWRASDPAGEEVLLTNEERAAEMERAQERETRYCAPFNP